MAEPRLRLDPADRIRRPPARPARRRPRSGKRILAGSGKVAVLLGLWAAIFCATALGYFALTLPDTGELTRGERRPSITMLAADGSLLTTYGDLFGQPLTLKEMSPYLPKAVIATEDHRFYSHFGIDPIGLARALFANISAGHVVQGGSTITQQLAKNLFLTPERSLTRKIRETLLALWLEHRFSKDQILEIYLNRVYLGAGTYGVDAAAHRYFQKSARRINLYESAVIAGLLKAPTRFNPTRDRDKTAARATQVLAKMVEARYITETQSAAAIKGGSSLAAVAVTRPGARYFADWVAEQLGEFTETTRDLTVVTTLDPRMQAEAEAAISDLLARQGGKMATRQGALVAMAPNGAVRAMVGGRDYGESQFNRATQAQRQPGSAFKPFVYLAGLEAGLQPTDVFIDAPISVGNWQPRDFAGHYQGEMSFAEGLAQSINTIAVQVAQRAGVRNVVAVARRLGISSPLTAEPSLALGTNEVNLIELVSAYAPFVNDGNGVWAHGITEIRDSSGKIVFRRAGSGLGQVVSPRLAGTMNEMLSAVIGHGTGKSAALPRPAAGKTGTTQDYRDAWFIGYTADLVAGVWLGNDDNSPMNKVTGGSLPAQAWRRFMLAATRSMPVRALPSAPSPSAGLVAEAPSRSGGGFFDDFFGLFRPGPPPEPPRSRGGP
jgi:penicillin-binding protein 1A